MRVGSAGPPITPANAWIGDEWPVHRVAIDLSLDIVTIDRTWSVQDVLDQNEALDVSADVAASNRPSPAAPDLPRPRKGAVRES